MYKIISVHQRLWRIVESDFPLYIIRFIKYALYKGIKNIV